MDEDYLITKFVLCRTDYGIGRIPDFESELAPTGYSLSNIDREAKWTTFQVWNDQGFIANFAVTTEDFDGYFLKQGEIIDFRAQLKSQDPEVRDAALKLLRQADIVSVIDSAIHRAILFVADKAEVGDDGNLKLITEVKNVRVQVDDEQSDEQADESDQQIKELRALVEEANGPWRYLDFQSSGSRQFVVRMVNRGQVSFATVPFDMVLHEVNGWMVPFADSALPEYMITDEGKVMLFSVSERCGPVVARYRDLADQFVAYMDKRNGIRYSVTEIQTAVKMPVSDLLDAIVQNDGANCAFLICLVAEECETASIIIYPVKPEPE